MALDNPSDHRSQSVLTVLVVTVVLGFVIWQAASALLLLFAGLLFGAFLDACTRTLGYFVSLSRPWRLAIVCVLLFTATAAGLIWGGANLIGQVDDLYQLVDRQSEVVRQELRRYGVSLRSSDGGQSSLPEILLPNPSRIVDTAYSALSAATGILGNAVIVVFVGIFSAANPDAYRQGLLSLIPRARRVRLGVVLDEMGEVLRRWLIGQIITGAVIASTTWIALAMIGLPGAFILGLQAGLLNFIPYLGALLATIPIALAATAQSMMMAIWVISIQLIIQVIEGYVLTPLVVRQATRVPPVLTLAFILVFGALFGVLGVALAAPLLAVLRIATIRLYIEDYLGGWHESREPTIEKSKS